MTNRVAMRPVFLALVPFACGSAIAQDGWYVGMELGLAQTPDTTIRGSDNDWSTPCDLLINPEGLETTADQCAAQPPPTAYTVDFGGGSGLFAAAALGYRMGRWNVEGEYLFRSSVIDDRVSDVRVGDDVTLGKLDQEIETTEGVLDDVLSHGFFANLHYRLGGGGWQPYVGLGVGMSRVAVSHASRWKRNDDPDRITTFTDPALRARLAGTATTGDARFNDTVFGYQLLAGMERPFGQAATFGVKFRWVQLGDFESDKIPWDQLRGHESSIGRGEQIVYGITTEDTGFWAVSVVMKYRL